MISRIEFFLLFPSFIILNFFIVDDAVAFVPSAASTAITIRTKRTQNSRFSSSSFVLSRIKNESKSRYYYSEFAAVTNQDENMQEVSEIKEGSLFLTTLPQYLDQIQEIDQDLASIICAAASACIDISLELTVLPIRVYQHQQQQQQEVDSSLLSSKSYSGSGEVNIQGEEQMPMDVIANNIFINAVKEHVAVMASEEVEEVISGSSPYGKYEISFDPLDGSSNLDVSVPTGTIFGIAPHLPDKEPFTSSGRSLVAAGYSVYSSSVEFVISLGKSGSLGAVGFTLDPSLVQKKTKSGTLRNKNLAECFVLSRPNMRCPKRGSYYSLNDGREPDWPDGLRRWIYDAKRGQTASGTVFSTRYVCSLCADCHRTFLKGGWAGNPRPHLRLLYEAAPLSHVAEACGGRGSNGIKNILDVEPEGLHSRTCVFIGSELDVLEMEGYGDIQQSAKTY